jgi:hypothetical protein
VSHTQIGEPGNGRLTFVFEDEVVSFEIATNATCSDIAWALDEMRARGVRSLVMIDVTLAPPSWAHVLPLC